MKKLVSTSTEVIVPGVPRRTIAQSYPGWRRRLVSQPSTISPRFPKRPRWWIAGPGLSRLSLSPKDSSLAARTLAPSQRAARSTIAVFALPFSGTSGAVPLPGDAGVALICDPRDRRSREGCGEQLTAWT